MPTYTGVTTQGGHTQAAIELAARTDVFGALAKRTVWDDLGDPDIDDDNPSPEVTTTTALEDVFVYKLCTLQLVLPTLSTDPNAFVVQGQYWKTVNEADFRTGNGRHVLVRTSINGDEGGLVPMTYLSNPAYYRQVGIYGGVTRAVGVSGSLNVLNASQVATKTLMYYSNTRPVPLSTSKNQGILAIVTR